MAAPPRIKLSAETAPDAPDWWKERVMPSIQAAFNDIRAALDRGLTVKENHKAGEAVGVTFTTKATVGDTWPISIKNNMPGGVRPTHLWCSDLVKTNGASISAAFSLTWGLDQAGMILLTLQGLEGSTEYKASIRYE